MSNYPFLPAPTFGISEHPFVTWRNAFTTEELDKIIEHGDSLEKMKASIGGGTPDDDISAIRESTNSWIQYDNDTNWIYDRLAYVARQINGQFYRFNLHGFNEDLQYTVYNSESNGHYTWHLDSGVTIDGMPPRKLSLVLQLSDPADYEGGDLEIMTSSTPQQVVKERGIIAAFPSYTLHRVTPVTAGIRKSLVVWATGPAFV
jgi:PKHD-type hydroxylase